MRDKINFNILNLFITTFLIVIALFIVISNNILFFDGLFGTHDFKEYWSAFNILAQEKNPYSPEIMLEFQAERFGKDTPLMMWNPPWLLLLLYPVLTFDFQTSAEIWIAVQIVLYSVSLLLLANIYFKDFLVDEARNYRLIFLLALQVLIFPPFYTSLYYGQIGSLLLFGATLIFWSLIKKSVTFFSLGVIILSIKPHLFLILSVLVIWHLIRKKQYNYFLLPAILIGFVLLLCNLAFPQSINFWIRSLLAENSSLVPTIYQWCGPNLGGALRIYVDSSFYYVSFLLAPFASLLLAIYLIAKKPEMDLKKTYPLALVISIFFSQFGWFFDQTVLLISVVAICSIVISHNLKFIFMCLLVLQVFTFYFLIFIANEHVELFWYPPALFLLLIASQILTCNNKRIQRI